MTLSTEEPKPRYRWSGCDWLGCGTDAPSKHLLQQVRAGFIRQGTTFTAWCNTNAINKSNARQAVLGAWDGPKGSQLRRRIVRAARIGEAA